MGRLEVSCRRFAILSGAEQDPADHAICVHPGAPGLQRKGTLAVITEAAGSYPALDVEACRLAQRVVVESYFADSALSLTSSLLNALDHANSALLQYNYTSHELPPGGTGEVVLQGGGAKGPEPAKEGRRYQRRAKVGATALLIRPDGAGIYLSQMAPTQAYVYHNGMLSAVPEPTTWKQAPQHSMAVMSGAQSASGAGLDDEEDLDESPETNVPSPSLGSGPGVEADLVYRRISAGDIVVVLSTSLARHLDRDRIEHLLSRYDADNVISALRGIAIDNGLAEAHACVLELGVLDSSGVEKGLEAQVVAQHDNQMAEGRRMETGGMMAAQHGAQHLLRPTFKEVLRGPREWLQRRKLEPGQADEASNPLPAEVQASETERQPSGPSLQPGQDLDPQFSTPWSLPEGSFATLRTGSEPAKEGRKPPAEDEEQFWSKQPTQLFPQRPIDMPPYRAAQEQGEQGSSPAFWEDEDDQELHFDGWEDAPPALDFPQYEVSHRVLFKPTTFVFEPDADPGTGPTGHPGSSESPPLSHSSAPSLRPALASSQNHSPQSSVLSPRFTRLDIREMAGSAGRWLLTTTRALIPDQRSRGMLVARGIKIGKTLPMRWVIGGALVIAGLLFIISVMSMAGNSQKAATQNILQEAQQMETLANQPGLLAADRLQKLQLALDKAQAAATTNPQSPDARLLATKIQNEIDQAQGITRFGSAKLLFDLDAIDNSSATGSASTPISATIAQTTVSGTLPLPLNDIFVQGNDAYILDRTGSKLYRCQIAATTCSAVLKSGDSAGGQRVGTLVAMTMRVGSPVLLDDKLVSYALSTDTGAWQAQVLGDAGSLQTPTDIASYDGNLYLLGARPGQISKYPSGQYDQSPLNWIQDQSTSDAMKAPAAMAIDGEIYVALADGKILTMQTGKLDQIVTPKAEPGQSAPTRIYTNTDVKDLYLLRAGDGTITHMSKAGDTIATLKAPAGMGLDKLSGMAVDEARGIYYLVEGRKVFQATLAAPTPAVHPTIAP